MLYVWNKLIGAADDVQPTYNPVCEHKQYIYFECEYFVAV